MFDILSLEPLSPDVLWVVIVGFLFAFLLAFGLGANDVANSFGTSVGSGVLTVRNACIVATVCEISGAMLLGSKVSDTMRKGILDVTVYNGAEKELMLGNLSTLVGASIWLILATILKFPISATHSVVGATVGFSLVARGSEGIHWDKLGFIALSWFVSPLLSGTISILLYIIIKKLILVVPEPLKQGLKMLPFIYAITILINVFSIVFEGPSVLYFDTLSWWVALLISIGVGFIVGICVHFFLSPYLRRKCLSDEQDLALANAKKLVAGASDLGVTNNGFSMTETVNEKDEKKDQIMTVTSLTSLDSDHHSNGGITLKDDVSVMSKESEAVMSKDNAVVENSTEDVKSKLSGIHAARDDDPPEIARLFTLLQILTATFCSFVHGGNDVSNAIGPLTAIWLIFNEGEVAQKSATPIWILLYGGLGISVGLWLWGRRVMKTIGTDLSKIVPSTGFVIELGAATTVLIASNIGIPISTTHCLVGSVVFVGRFSSSKEGVNWTLFRNIFFAWIVTLPISAGISALVMLLLKNTAL